MDRELATAHLPLFKGTLRFVLAVAFTPRRATERLLGDPRRLAYGTSAWLFIGIVYGLAALIGGLRGAAPVVDPWIPMPGDYYVGMGLITPVLYLLYFTLLAGLLQLLGRVVKAAGTYEDCFSIATLTFTLPVLVTMWIFEAPALLFMSAQRLQAQDWYLPAWFDTARQIIGVAWVFVVLVQAVATLQRVTIRKAALLSLLASVPAWATMLVFLR